MIKDDLHIENAQFILFLFLSLIFLSLSLFIIKAKNLFSIIISLCLLSLIMTLYYLILDAPDVALTEAAVGACATTAILFFTVIKLNIKSAAIDKIKWDALFICLLLFGILAIVGFHLPDFGAADTITNSYITPHYIRSCGNEIGIKSVVSSILASYRGLDTFCETLVIAIGGIAVPFILKRVNLK